MRIRIIIEDDGQGLDIRRDVLGRTLLGPGTGPGKPAGCETAQGQPETASGNPFGKESVQELHAGRLLEALGIDKPGRILKQFRPERIIEVCEAAERKKARLKSPQGYVIRALRQGWAV